MIDRTHSENISLTGSRLVANVLDNMIITFFTFIAVVALGFSSLGMVSMADLQELLTWNLNSYVESAGTYELLKSAVLFALYMTSAYVLMSIVYFQYFLATPQRSTIGMKLFKLQLRGVDESELSGIRVFGRNILFILFKFIYIGGISIITMVVTQQGQALHDMATNTKVVYKK